MCVVWNLNSSRGSNYQISTLWLKDKDSVQTAIKYDEFMADWVRGMWQCEERNKVENLPEILARAVGSLSSVVNTEL